MVSVGEGAAIQNLGGNNPAADAIPPQARQMAYGGF
jgi:hypothetical protein